MSDAYVCVACDGPYPCPTHPDAAAEPAAGPTAAVPALIRLDRFLDQPDPEVVYRFADLWPADARVLLAAQYKAGKTTAVANVLRSLVDLEPFLGAYKVAPPTGRVVLIDDELHENTLRRWLREQDIANPDRVDVVPLRGRLSTFDIMGDQGRDQWAQRIADADASVVILDCLRPLVDALGLSEDKDTGKVLGAFDELLTSSGASEAVIVHHMGHHGERSRGDSRLRDWPDAEWRIVRDGDEPNSPRYFAAYGRDVDVAEQRLELTGRRLAIAGGSRKEAVAEAALDDVLELLDGQDDPLSGRAIEKLLEHSDHARTSIRAAVKLGVRDGRIAVEDGPRNSKLHTSAPVRGSAPPVRQRTSGECASAPIGGALHTHPAEPPSARPNCGRCGRTSFADPCRECKAAEAGAA